MATFKIFRETTLPGTLQPYAMYVVAPASKPDYIELYVTNAAGTATRRLLTQADIQGLIDASLTAISQIQIVANIAARDALAPTTTLYVYVQDATGDATVASGGATYLYNVADAAFFDHEQGRLRVIDVKGAPETEAFKLKRKMMRVLKGIDVEVVR